MAKKEKTREPQVNKAEPAFTVVTLLGGVRAVARYMEISPGAVSHWCTKRDAKNGKSGGNGIIPAYRHADLIAMANELGVRGVKAKLGLM